jgi:hypothetical protein
MLLPGDIVEDTTFTTATVLTDPDNCGPYCVLATAGDILQQNFASAHLVNRLLGLLYTPGTPEPAVLASLTTFGTLAHVDAHATSHMNRLRVVAATHMITNHTPPRPAGAARFTISGVPVNIAWLKAAAIAIGAKVNIFQVSRSNGDVQLVCVEAEPMFGNRGIFGACNILYQPMDEFPFQPLYPDLQRAALIHHFFPRHLETFPDSELKYEVTLLTRYAAQTTERFYRIDLGRFSYTLRASCQLTRRWQEALFVAFPKWDRGHGEVKGEEVGEDYAALRQKCPCDCDDFYSVFYSTCPSCDQFNNSMQEFGH